MSKTNKMRVDGATNKLERYKNKVRSDTFNDLISLRKYDREQIDAMMIDFEHRHIRFLTRIPSSEIPPMTKKQDESIK